VLGRRLDLGPRTPPLHCHTQHKKGLAYTRGLWNIDYALGGGATDTEF